MLRSFSFLLFSLLIFCTAASGQTTDHRACNIDERLNILIKNNPEVLGELDYFYNKRFNQSKSAERTEIVYTIPVVIHIIHHGEPIGSGPNIGNDKIFAQMDILNEDYSFTNDDSDQVPQLFKSDAADTKIRFCLIQKDASGDPHPGFNRIEYDEIPNFEYIEEVIKPATSWNSRKFMNIWVLKMPEDHVLGYSYPPIPNVLNTTKDGIVIAYDKFGIDEQSLGRTATHEIGHYLGLQHPWGSVEGCDVDDGLEDTPLCRAPYYGCPVYPQQSCGTIDMFMNFMDYVNDDCMYMFTNDQGARMREVLQNERFAITTGYEFICELSTSNVEAEDKNTNEIKVFPNPSNGFVNIECTRDMELKDAVIEVFNIPGQKIQANAYQSIGNNDKIQLDLSELSNGTYFIKIEAEDEILVTKLILMSRH